MFYEKNIKNHAKGGDERSIESTGRSASITLIIGVCIFLIEMLVKLMITKDWNAITWEAVLLLVMIVLYVIVHMLNKIPMEKYWQ